MKQGVYTGDFHQFINDIPQAIFEVNVDLISKNAQFNFVNKIGEKLFKRIFGIEVFSKGFNLMKIMENISHIDTLIDFGKNPNANGNLTIRNREYLLKTKDNKQILLQASMLITRNKSQVLARGIITEHSKIVKDEVPKTKVDYYRSIEEEVENLRDFFDTFDALIMIINEMGRIIFISPNVGQDILYRPREEIIGRTLHEIFPQGQADFFSQQFTETLKNGESTDFEYHLPIQNKVLWFQCRIIPVLVKDGKFTQVVAIIRDITKWRVRTIINSGI